MDHKLLIEEHKLHAQYINQVLSVVLATRKYGFCLGQYKCMPQEEREFYAALFVFSFFEKGREWISSKLGTEDFKESMLLAIENSEALKENIGDILSRSRWIEE